MRTNDDKPRRKIHGEGDDPPTPCHSKAMTLAPLGFFTDFTFQISYIMITEENSNFILT